MEDHNNIVGHPFLGNDDLFTTVDDKVATLVIDAFLGISNFFLVIEVLKVTKVGPDHYWNLSNEHLGSVVLFDNSLNFLFFLFSSLSVGGRVERLQLFLY